MAACHCTLCRWITSKAVERALLTLVNGPAQRRQGGHVDSATQTDLVSFAVSPPTQPQGGCSYCHGSGSCASPPPPLPPGASPCRSLRCGQRAGMRRIILQCMDGSHNSRVRSSNPRQARIPSRVHDLTARHTASWPLLSEPAERQRYGRAASRVVLQPAGRGDCYAQRVTCCLRVGEVGRPPGWLVACRRAARQGGGGWWWLGGAAANGGLEGRGAGQQGEAVHGSPGGRVLKVHNSHGAVCHLGAQLTLANQQLQQEAQQQSNMARAWWTLSVLHFTSPPPTPTWHQEAAAGRAADSQHMQQRGQQPVAHARRGGRQQLAVRQ